MPAIFENLQRLTRQVSRADGTPPIANKDDISYPGEEEERGAFRYSLGTAYVDRGPIPLPRHYLRLPGAATARMIHIKSGPDGDSSLPLPRKQVQQTNNTSVIYHHIRVMPAPPRFQTTGS